MGRYYSGDIEGKFWFGVQSSNDASFFGGTECEPAELNYYFEKSDMPDIEKGIKECKEALKGWKPKLDKFFKENNGYNDEMLVKYLELDPKEMKDNFSHPKVRELLEWYARLALGEKIKKCVKKQGYCSFTAEL